MGKVWEPFDYARSPEEAQACHDDMEHEKHTGVKTWQACPTVRCAEARDYMHGHFMDCPTCGGTGQVYRDLDGKPFVGGGG